MSYPPHPLEPRDRLAVSRRADRKARQHVEFSEPFLKLMERIACSLEQARAAPKNIASAPIVEGVTKEQMAIGILLTSPHLTKTEIAKRLGYTHPTSLSRFRVFSMIWPNRKELARYFMTESPVEPRSADTSRRTGMRRNSRVNYGSESDSSD